MNLSVSPGAEEPLYRQLYDRIAFGILRGDIAPGSSIPPIRTVAQELRISVISVKRAWEELERDGYIITAVGRGTTAAELSAEEKERRRKVILSERLQAALFLCRELGISADEASDVIRSSLD